MAEKDPWRNLKNTSNLLGNDMTKKQPPEVFYKKGALKNFANWEENTCARDFFKK